MEIVFIRHGECVANKLNENVYTICTGQYDCELTEKGKEQAKRLEHNPILKDYDVLIASDLKRTYETALHVGTDIIKEPRIRERSLGEFEGKLVKDLVLNPDYKPYFEDPTLKTFGHSFTVKAPSGENYEDVTKRVGEFLEELYSKNYKKVTIVGHMIAFRCMLYYMGKLTKEEALTYKIKNCDPFVVEWNK